MVEKNSKTGHRQKLRERFLTGDKQSRNETALLELLLTYAIPRKDVRPLAKALISKFGDLSEILSTSPDMLCETKGIGEAAAVLLKIADLLRIHYPARTQDGTEVAEPSGYQAPLFEDPESKSEKASEPHAVEKVSKPKKQRSGLFGKAALREAIDLLPGLPDTESLDEARMFFRENLHYSAESTRNRCSNYIVRRMFPKGKADAALRNFAKTFKGGRDLKEVCFYRFMRAEPLVTETVCELMLPNVGIGELKRQRLKNYLEERFPGYKSINDCSKSLVDALVAGGVVRADRKKITFAYRDIPLPAFAFILHSEFPEPGMYDLSKLEKNRAFTAMLWNPDLILGTVYELRNQGFVSKVSEIDTVRQFTTRWSLGEVVEKLLRSNRD